MDLYLLRHGEAGKSMPGSSKDAKRTLTQDGRAEVEAVGKAIRMLDLGLDLLASSPLSRAFDTAAIVGRQIRLKGQVEVWDELKPEGERRTLYARLGRLRPDSSVMIVGHEPYLGNVVGDIIGGHARVNLKKAGLVRVRVSSVLPSPKGELRWLLSPRVLKALAQTS